MKNKYAVRVMDNSNANMLFAVRDNASGVWSLVGSDGNPELFEDKDEADKVTEFFASMFKDNATVKTLLMEGTMELGVSILGRKMKGMTPKDSDWNGEV